MKFRGNSGHRKKERKKKSQIRSRFIVPPYVAFSLAPLRSLPSPPLCPSHSPVGISAPRTRTQCICAFCRNFKRARRHVREHANTKIFSLPRAAAMLKIEGQLIVPALRQINNERTDERANGRTSEYCRDVIHFWQVRAMVSMSRAYKSIARASGNPSDVSKFHNYVNYW